MVPMKVHLIDGTHEQSRCVVVSSREMKQLMESRSFLDTGDNFTMMSELDDYGAF